MISHRIVLAFMLGCISAGIAACHGSELTAPEHELPAEAGRPLALPGTVFGETPLLWTRGEEVVTQVRLGEGGVTGLVAVRPSDGRVRLPAVPAPQPYVYYAGFDVSETGTAYAVRGEGPAASPDHVLYRAAPGDSAERLDDRLGGGALLSGNGGGVPVAVAFGEIAVAYAVAPDSLVIFTPSTGGRRVIGVGCASVVAISPDAARVLCLADRATRSYFIVNVADGARVPVPLPGVDANATLVFRLDDGGIRVLVSQGFDVNVLDLTTGVTTHVWAGDAGTSLFAQPIVDNTSLAWSADGRRVAFWTGECLRDADFTSCGYDQKVLQVFDLVERQLRHAAVLKGKGVRVGSLALSPDGRQAAYAEYDGGLYVSEVP